ncbi:MAG: Oxidoreductase, partial [uncultured Thermomicrobiales bacterium]
AEATHRGRDGQRHRARGHAPVHQVRPAVPGGRRRGGARGPGRRRDAHRHRGRLLPRRVRVRAQRVAGGRGARLLRPRRRRRPGGDQGRAHPPGHRLGAGRVAGLPAPRCRGLAAAAGGRRDRALPVPPARPAHAVGGVDGRAAGTRRRRAGAHGRGLQRRHRADRRRPLGHRRRLRQRAEPVLAGLAVLRGRAGALRGPRAGLHPVEPVRRRERGRLAGRRRAGLRGGRRGAGSVGVPGGPGLAPRAGRRRRPHPRGVADGVDHRLRRRGRPGTHPRPARPPLRV